MAEKKKRRARARNLCSHFDGTLLGGCARTGLSVLEARDKALIKNGANIACGVGLDRCLAQSVQHRYSNRWDYIFTLRDTDEALGIEVHPASVDQVDEMIAKQVWASAVLSTECQKLRVRAWIWLAPPGTEILFPSALHPAVRKLAESGISFPRPEIELP